MMKTEHEFDEPIEITPPRNLVIKLTKLHPKLRRIVLRVAAKGEKNARKVNSIAFESFPPDEEPDEIAELLAAMASSNFEEHERPPEYYEAMCEIQPSSGSTKKVSKYVRFAVDPDGEISDKTDESEAETIVRSAMMFIDVVTGQNKELHQTLIDNTKIIREATMPLQATMKEMGEIVANAYKLASYAQFLVMEMQRQDRELEVSAEKWREGMGLLKEVVPKIVKQKLERLEKKLGLSSDDESTQEGEKNEPEHPSPGEEDVQRDENGEVVINMAEACRDFGSSIEPQQWAKLRKALGTAELELFEKVMSVPEGENELATGLVVRLAKLLDRPSIKLELGMIFTGQQIAVIRAIIKLAFAAQERKQAQTSPPHQATYSGRTDDEEISPDEEQDDAQSARSEDEELADDNTSRLKRDKSAKRASKKRQKRDDD